MGNPGKGSLPWLSKAPDLKELQNIQKIQNIEYTENNKIQKKKKNMVIQVGERHIIQGLEVSIEEFIFN